MTTGFAPVWSMRFVRAYIVTMRPYLLFVSGAAGLVGLSFGADLGAWRTVLAFVALFFSYGLGQALTDCFQTDTDSISAPYRPLVAGVISRRQVLTVSMVEALRRRAGSRRSSTSGSSASASRAVVGLLTYTFFKRTWWGGPPWNSWIVALIPVMGRLVDRGWSPVALVRHGGANDAAFLLAVLAVFFGYANFVVMGYFKDISADRATGYRTFPVVFGWRAAAVYGDVTALLAAALTAGALALLGPNAASIVDVRGGGRALRPRADLDASHPRRAGDRRSDRERRSRVRAPLRLARRREPGSLAARPSRSSISSSNWR